MTTRDLYTVEEALAFNRKQVRENYRVYVNPGLSQMLSLLDFDKRFIRAEGVKVWDEDGNEYLDFLGAYGALNLGHNPKKVWEAVDKVRHSPNLLQASLGAMSAALGHNLAQITPGELSRSFFCNSGAEAVEGALKLARAASGKEKFIYCESSFHGKSMGALSVTGREKYRKPFKPLIPETSSIPFGDLNALEHALQSKDAAAFIVEPIQGEGGIIVPLEGYLGKAKKLCEKYDAFLIADEIQTGLGRTGTIFACEQEEVTPDILCLAKSLGGGVAALGAYVTTPKIWDKAFGGMDKSLLHTSTFGGNTIAAAAGIASIQTMVEDNLSERAHELGRYFLDRLLALRERHPLIYDVRGRGLMLGLEFAKPDGGIMDKLTAGKLNKLSEEYLGSLVAGELMNRHNVITAYTLNNPNVIRLEPPLVVEKEHIDKVVEALDEVLSNSKSFAGMAISTGRAMMGNLFKK